MPFVWNDQSFEKCFLQKIRALTIVRDPHTLHCVAVHVKQRTKKVSLTSNRFRDKRQFKLMSDVNYGIKFNYLGNVSFSRVTKNYLLLNFFGCPEMQQHMDWQNCIKKPQVKPQTCNYTICNDNFFFWGMNLQ